LRANLGNPVMLLARDCRSERVVGENSSLSSRAGLALTLAPEAQPHPPDGSGGLLPAVRYGVLAGPAWITPRTWSTETGSHGNATRPQVAPAAA
jgi:hypothetical protein